MHYYASRTAGCACRHPLRWSWTCRSPPSSRRSATTAARSCGLICPSPPVGGFHPQELVHVCLNHGHAATRVELFPVLRATPDGAEHVVAYPDDNWVRFTRVIEQSRGVIEGVGRRCGHAVAYEYGHIFDPDGCEYGYSRDACQQHGFFTQYLWRIDRIGV